LQTVQDRGEVVCATLDDTPGFGFLDEQGNHLGFDIDLCRAVAAATLGDADAVELRTIDAAERGPVMQAGEVDLLVWVTTWTSSRDAAWGDFVPTMFYDGQGFMVPNRLAVSSAYELGGAAVCTTAGTTSELNMEDFFRQNRMEYNPLIFETGDLALDAYTSGVCDVFTTDRSALAALRTSLPNPEEHMILPEVISEEPLTPMVPHGDSQWFDIVKSVMAILIYAEAYGVNSDNVSAMTTSDNVKVKRLLGAEGSWGQADLGLDTTVAQNVITQVGNYGEIYDRHLGYDGIGLPREGGRNALWADAPCADCPKGGQIYAAPLR
jgi:general L-amino acid transport system substrate-binding protein